MKIKVGTLSLNVLESGAGEPTLLFLHYWGGSARTWNRVIEKLCSTLRCIAYDQRGWGESDAPADGYTIADLAGDAAGLIRTFDLKRYVLVGHSMGGKAAQFLEAQQPVGLEALVLVAPASPLPQNIPEAAREAQLHAYDTRDTVLQAIAFLTAHPPNESTVEQIVSKLEGSQTVTTIFMLLGYLCPSCLALLGGDTSGPSWNPKRRSKTQMRVIRQAPTLARGGTTNGDDGWN